MAGRLFITDLDGTLFMDDKTIHPEDFRTLEILKANQVVVAIATGRSLYSFEKAMRELKKNGGPDVLPVDYILFSTGAGIYECATGRIVYKRDIPPDQIPIITRCMDRREMDYMVHAAIPDTRMFLYRSFEKENPDFYRRIQMYNSYANVLEPGYRFSEPATEVLAIQPDPDGTFDIEELAKELEQFSVIQATSPLDHQSAWIEVFHPEVSKSRTSAFLAAELGIGPGQAVSVGNDYNDQDLLAWTERGYITENGPVALKDRFDVVPSNNQCGVTRAAALCGWLEQS